MNAKKMSGKELAAALDEAADILVAEFGAREASVNITAQQMREAARRLAAVDAVVKEMLAVRNTDTILVARSTMLNWTDRLSGAPSAEQSAPCHCERKEWVGKCLLPSGCERTAQGERAMIASRPDPFDPISRCVPKPLGPDDVLPRDVDFGGVVFRKGVKWSTMIGAVKRWRDALAADGDERAGHLRRGMDEALGVAMDIAAERDAALRQPAQPEGAVRWDIYDPPLLDADGSVLRDWVLSASTRDEKVARHYSALDTGCRVVPLYTHPVAGSVTEEMDRETLFAAVREVVARIEACGASPELTHASSLACDLMRAIGNKWNKADKHAADSVRAALQAALVKPT